jgi:hypothetical protein
MMPPRACSDVMHATIKAEMASPPAASEEGVTPAQMARARSGTRMRQKQWQEKEEEWSERNGVRDLIVRRRRNGVRGME